MPNFVDTLRTLPSVEHIARLELRDINNHLVGSIENRPGSAGSVAVYHAVTSPNGWLNVQAAQHALDLYAEHTADARAHPGKHPNIDRLFALIESGQRLRIDSVLR